MPDRTIETYRLFWIDGSGRVDAVSKPFSAADDADALQQAIPLAEGDRAELWAGERLVARLDLPSSTGAPH